MSLNFIESPASPLLLSITVGDEHLLTHAGQLGAEGWTIREELPIVPDHLRRPHMAHRQEALVVAQPIANRHHQA